MTSEKVVIKECPNCQDWLVHLTFVINEVEEIGEVNVVDIEIHSN